MILTNSQIKAIKELGSPGPECINDLLDTIADKDSQIEQLKAQVEAAFAAANNAIYFNDNSDYLGALYEVCKAIKPSMEVDLIGSKCIFEALEAI
jgi:hypothetical protein